MPFVSLDENFLFAVHTVDSVLETSASSVKVAWLAKKSRFSSLKTVADELETAELLEDATEELEAAEEEDLALELLTAERSSGILVIQWLSMSLQSDWRRDSIMERFE